MRLFLVLILISLSLVGFAQQQPTREELEQRRRQLLETIKETEYQLAATQKNTKATMGQLRTLQAKLAGRQKLIDNINQEIEQIGSSIQYSTAEIDKMKGNLVVLKARYAQSVRYAYKSRTSYDMLAFLFSSNDFNEAIRRMKYLKRYRDYRKDQAEQIRKTQARLMGEVETLNNEKAKKDLLLSAEEQQKKAIEEDRNKTNTIIKELKGQEKDLTAKIIKNRRVQQQVDRAVEEMIRKELEAERKRAAEEERRRKEEEVRRQEEERKRAAATTASNKPVGGRITVENNAGDIPPKPSTSNNTTMPGTGSTRPAATPPAKPVPAHDYGLTPEGAALSNNFEANRGKLPWPVEKGFISLGFGPYKHPLAEKVTLENLGINITTPPGGNVRSCFEGNVVKVFTMDGKQWNVLVNHGRYSTLYMNLSKINVKAGQKVATKQSLGSAAVNEDGESVINFQIWIETRKVDPASWISR